MPTTAQYLNIVCDMCLNVELVLVVGGAGRGGGLPLHLEAVAEPGTEVTVQILPLQLT